MIICLSEEEATTCLPAIRASLTCTIVLYGLAGMLLRCSAAGVRYYAYIIDSVQEHYASNVCLIIVVDYNVILELRHGFKMFNGEAGCLALRI